MRNAIWLAAVVSVAGSACAPGPRPTIDPGAPPDGGPDPSGGAPPATNADAGVDPPRPQPRLGLGRPTAGSGTPSLLVDGLFQQPMWTTGAPGAAAPSWAAVDVGSGPAQLLAQWSDENNANIEAPSTGAPLDYTLQTSADSTDGSDGTWITAVTVTANPYSYRAHLVPFAGQRWIKLVVTASQGGGPLSIGELELWDASAGADDSWFFVGDSITARCTKRNAAQLPGFQGYLNALKPGRWPMQTNGGIVGQPSWGLLHEPNSRLDAYLAAFPNRYWPITVWSNDTRSPSLPRPTDVYPGMGDFPARLGLMVAKIRAAGRVPIIGQEPYTDDPTIAPTLPLYNAAAAAFAKANGIALGPDLYTMFQRNVAAYGYSNPGSYYDADHIHPNPLGCKAIEEAWAKAVAALYAP